MNKLIISALELTHFKNHRSTHWDFNEKVNIITGNNGNGKTNVLDALHYLSLTRSYLGSTDGQNITHGESMARIKPHESWIGAKNGQVQSGVLGLNVRQKHGASASSALGVVYAKTTQVRCIDIFGVDGNTAERTTSHTNNVHRGTLLDEIGRGGWCHALALRLFIKTRIAIFGGVHNAIDELCDHRAWRL